VWWRGKWADYFALREKKCSRLLSDLDVTIIAVEHDHLKAKPLQVDL
jgi:hypothetical protein